MDIKGRLAELLDQHQQLTKRRDRLDFADAGDVSAMTLHRLLKSIVAVETEIDELKQELGGPHVGDLGLSAGGSTTQAMSN